jgi:phenylpyruvate tautomerase PptA (4-oxalocrotonate tautomerase family)
MPIVDIELACASKKDATTVSSRVIADALGQVFASAPGRTWVRLRFLDRDAYAENGIAVEPSALPAFVTVLHAHPPTGAALVAEVNEVTRAVAQCLARPSECVHVQYAPAGAGRQAFGGKLVG